MPRVRPHHLLLPLAALLALSPTLVRGVSPGQDLGFHTLSWLDAAAQLRHGHYPHWATTPAWNAGEPRFVFYPPLSWLFGALLTMVLPRSLGIDAAITTYLFVVLTATGLAMRHLARHFVSPAAATLAAAFYLANPYLLFCVFERSAMAELMASIWLPLLLLGILRARPTIRGIAIPLALLWLTNAPAAVIASYTLALLATLRVLSALLLPTGRFVILSEAQRSRRTPKTLASPRLSAPFPPPSSKRNLSPAFHLTLTYLSGTALGLTLPAFYLVPAAYERRYVQVAMAIIPNMRFQDNFLFAHTADAPHNAVNHTASLLAVTLLALTVTTLSIVFLRRAHPSSVILREGSQLYREPQSKDPEAASPGTTAGTFPPTKAFTTPTPFSPIPSPLSPLLILTTAIAFLLVPISTPLWNHLPNLAYLQFPWRLLTLLAVVLAFAIALLLNRINLRSKALYAAPILSLALGLIGYGLYHQASSPTDNPATWAALFHTGHGAPPTDEYTPTDADNDQLRTNNPAYWFATDPNAPAPHTLANPATLTGDYDTPIAPANTLSTATPHDLTVNGQRGQFLVLNLRNYPAWNVAITNACSPSPSNDAQTRDDGLIAIPLHCDTQETVHIAWQRTPDQTLGVALTLLALIALAATHAFISQSQLKTD